LADLFELNFCICKNWTVDKVQELGDAKCNIMWSELQHHYWQCQYTCH